MGDHELSRREVLAGIAAVGGSGALGAATGAVLRDDVTIASGTFGAGVVDLRIEHDGDGPANGAIDVPLADATSGSITVTVHNEHNPVYPWIATTCLGDDDLAEALSVTLSSVDCTSGEERSVIASGTTFPAFAEALAGGIALDGDPESAGRSCLGTGGELCLELSWSLADSFAGEVAAGFTLEFLGRQCRHNDGEANPFGAEAETCGGSEAAGTDISWLSFCGVEGETLERTALEFDVDGDTLALQDAPDSLGTVLLKNGPELRVFEDPDVPSTFRTTDGGRTYSQDGPAFPETEPLRTNPEPCPGTCGITYEITGGDPVLRSEKGCSQ